MNPKEMTFRDGRTSVVWRERTEGWNPGSEYLTIEDGDRVRVSVEMPFIEEIVRKVKSMRGKP